MRKISSFIGARPPLGGANTQSKKYILHSVSAFALSTMPRLGDANTHASQIGQFPLSRRRRPRLLRKSVNSPLEKALHSLFLLQNQAQKKKLSKRKRRNWAFALCGARQELRVPPSRRRRHTCFAYVSIPRLRKPPQRLDLNFNGKMRAKTLLQREKLLKAKKQRIQ